MQYCWNKEEEGRSRPPNMTEHQELAGVLPHTAKEKKSKSSSSSSTTNQNKKNKKNSTRFLKLLGKKLLHDLEKKKKYKPGYGGRTPNVSCQCTADGSACPCGDDGTNRVAVTTIKGTNTILNVVEVVKDEETLLYVPKEDGGTNYNNEKHLYGHNVSGTPLGYAPNAPPPSDFGAGATSWFEQQNTDTTETFTNTNIATSTITVNPDGVLTNSRTPQREEAALIDVNGINWNDI